MEYMVSGILFMDKHLQQSYVSITFGYINIDHFLCFLFIVRFEYINTFSVFSHVYLIVFRFCFLFIVLFIYIHNFRFVFCFLFIVLFEYIYAFICFFFHVYVIWILFIVYSFNNVCIHCLCYINIIIQLTNVFVAQILCFQIQKWFNK